jgi:hypothetical protein
MLIATHSLPWQGPGGSLFCDLHFAYQRGGYLAAKLLAISVPIRFEAALTGSVAR